MATSITQAKPLLTATELELFDHSRATPIKAYTAKQIAGKEKRARALRDKYRDLYRRQTLAQRGKAGKSAPNAGEANARTQRKADIMQEVLERYEARSSLLAAREEREATHTPARKPAARAPAKKASKPAAGAAAQKPAARSKPVAGKPAAASKKASSKSSNKAPVHTRAASAKSDTRNSAAKSTRVAPLASGKPKDTEHPISAVAHLQDGSGSAAHLALLTGQDTTERSTKAPSDLAPTYGGKAEAPDINAPLDIVASAKRGNPVREMPGNIAIQGHVSSAVRRSQGKRDSR